jgi:hypothetical protein
MLQGLEIDQVIDAGKPGVFTCEITPEDAERLLERNKKNRARKERAIVMYSRMMKQGRWHITNQGIGFDRDGLLTDGQNRLYACLRAQTAFRTTLVTGMVPEAKEAVDVGVKRTLADALKMEGYVNSMVIGGAVALRTRYDRLVETQDGWVKAQSWEGRLVLSHAESIDYLHKHESITERAQPASSWRRNFPRCPLSAAVAFESMAFEVDPSDLDRFRDTTLSGINLNAYDPRLILRQYLTRLGTGKRAVNSMQLLGIFIKAWNAWRLGESRQLLVLKDNEVMPELM